MILNLPPMLGLDKIGPARIKNIRIYVLKYAQMPRFYYALAMKLYIILEAKKSILRK